MKLSFCLICCPHWEWSADVHASAKSHLTRIGGFLKEGPFTDNSTASMPSTPACSTGSVLHPSSLKAKAFQVLNPFRSHTAILLQSPPPQDEFRHLPLLEPKPCFPFESPGPIRSLEVVTSHVPISAWKQLLFSSLNV